MSPNEFINRVTQFDALPGPKRVLLMGWYLHVYRNAESFNNDAIRACFREAHRCPPDVSIYLPRMAAKKPPLLIKERGQYRLEGSIRRELDAKYGDQPAFAAVSRILTELPKQIPDLAERAFLVEALDCYRVNAFRAAIVMTWNMAFDHLCRWILADPSRITKFNDAIKARYPKKNLTIVCLDDFEELKESEVVEVCQAAGLFSKNIIGILRDKLKRRNMAAHPSHLKIVQPQADDSITDLVNNVVLALR